MPRYLEVVAATTETATKILTLRDKKRRHVDVTTNGGKTASVSWNPAGGAVTLNMPTLPPDAVLTRGEADRLVAFIAHECCHVLHTDKRAWGRACALGGRIQSWTNALEDVRIERAEIKIGQFPALQSLLGNMANHLHYEALTETRATGRVIGTKIADAPYVTCILGRVANGYVMPAASQLLVGVSDEVAPIVRHALAGIKKCRNTDNVVDLARALVLMEQALPQPQPQEGEDKGSEGTEGEGEGSEGTEGEGEGSEGTEGEGEGEGSEGTEGEGEGSEGTEGEGEGSEGTEGEGEGSEGTKGEGEGEGSEGMPTDTDLGKAVEQIAKRAGIKSIDEYQARDKSHLLSVMQTTVKGEGARTGAFENRFAANTLNQRLPRNSVLHGQIGRMLVSAEINRRTHHESTGRLDRRALSRMRAGARDVFSKRDDTPGIDTALMVLIDGSSSMAGERMEMAQTAAWHIARAAEAANAKVSIAGFHTDMGRLNPTQLAQRVYHAVLTIVKPWTMPAADCAHALSELKADYSTPLSQTILACSRMLAEVNATRHILMVLTDGECDMGAGAVTRACHMAEDYGVEAVGVGIACQVIADAFPPRYSVNVVDMAQLASTGLGVLCAMLEDANPRGAD